MLEYLSKLIGFKIHAVDRVIGRVHEIYFDDYFWRIRYEEANIGCLLTGKEILISTMVIGRTGICSIGTFLTSEQLVDYSNIIKVKPLTREYSLSEHSQNGVFA